MAGSYKTQRFSADLEAGAYIAGFRRADYFLGLCSQCRNFGRRHGCPPFDYDPLSVIERFSRVRILGEKVVPADPGLPLSAVNSLIAPVTEALNRELLALESELDGLSFGFVGSCPYCGEATCSRIDGLPCRHPELMRPSLEAFGFDLTKTALELLGLEIKWSRDGLVPEYLTLIGGVFYGPADLH